MSLLGAGGFVAVLYCLCCLQCLGGCSATFRSSITVDLSKPAVASNPLLFGQNIPFASSGMWNSRTDGIDAGAEPLIRKIAPAVLRFPGGSQSDLYLWEDGLSFHAASAVNLGDTAFELTEEPNWGKVGKARFLDSMGGQFGDSFSFSSVERHSIQGVGGFNVPHPAGSAIRPEARPGQPEWFNNCYGIDEHMKLAQSSGAVSVITINFSTGLDKTGQVSTSASLDQRIKRAAAWVAYLNGDPGDTRPIGVDPEGNDWKTVGYWAYKRSEHGRQAPWRVVWWEIGNEQFEHSEVGCTTARAYGDAFVSFAGAMKAIDPSIKVGAVGMSRSDGKGDMDTVDGWNDTVLRTTRDHLDFFIVHSYYPSAGQAQVPYNGETWYMGVMAGAAQAYAHLRETRSLIDKTCPRAGGIELAITEYGIWPADSKNARDFSSLARAVYDADLLVTLLCHARELGVSLATGWNLHGNIETALIRYDWKTGIRTARPQYYAFELARRFMAARLVDTRVQCSSFSSPRLGNMDAMSSVPVLNAVAGIDSAGRLILLVVNRSQAEPVTASIGLTDFRPRPAASVTSLTAQSLGANNEEDPAAVVPGKSSLRHASSSFSYSFPAHSLTLFELEPER